MYFNGKLSGEEIGNINGICFKQLICKNQNVSIQIHVSNKLYAKGKSI